MPTGYTAKVQSGDITEFKDFALLCSSAFVIRLRDTPLDVGKIRADLDRYYPLDKTDSYYAKRIESSVRELSKVVLLGDAEVMLKQREERHDAEVHRNQFRASRRTSQVRYTLMLDQVKRWTPPTDKHVEMKKYMIEQLEGSLDFDCGGNYEPDVPKILDASQWRRNRILELTKEIEYNREQDEEEKKRNAENREWIDALLDSLEAF